MPYGFQGVPTLRTETIICALVIFFLTSSFWITVIVPLSYTPFVSHYKPSEKFLSSHSIHNSENNNLNLNDQTKKIAIFCLERSGSTWLTAMLNKNKNVNILAEPLHPFARKHETIENKKLAASEELDYLTSTLNVAVMDKSLRLVGFNEKFIFPKYIMPTQLEIMNNFSTYLSSNKYGIILLLRKNVVFQAVSMIRAVQLAGRCGNDAWSKTHEAGWQELCGKHHAELMKEPIVMLDLKTNIVRAQKKTEELIMTLKALQQPFITIYYEDLNEHPDRVMRRISDFTGVKLEVKETLFVKQGDVDLRRTVPNVDEVMRYLGALDSCLIDQVKNFNPPQFCSNLE